MIKKETILLQDAPLFDTKYANEQHYLNSYDLFPHGIKRRRA